MLSGNPVYALPILSVQSVRHLGFVFKATDNIVGYALSTPQPTARVERSCR
jgi:hypothetical protein